MISPGGLPKQPVDDPMFRFLVAIQLLLAAATYGCEAVPRMSRANIISVQIGLDDVGFSPGQIDGKWGAGTEQALAAWQQAHDLKPTGKFDSRSETRTVRKK